MSAPELMTEGQSKAWLALEALDKGASLSIPELVEQTGLADKTLRHMLNRWGIQGVVEITGGARKRRYAIRVRKKRPVGPPEQRLWLQMRSLGRFSVRDLLVAASVEGAEITEDEATRFVQMLLKAGFVSCYQKAKPGQRIARYKLVINNGVRPPEKRRVWITIDPNTGDVYLPEGRE